ncbi:MAG: PAS domain S-box protein [Methanoregula sp.]|nr:PAS domain S-box protein [Methanoregula sp.]
MDIITLLVFFCLASAILTYGLGVSVYTKNPQSSVHRLFFLAMLFASYWALGEFLTWQATGRDEVLFWLKASSFWTLVIAFTLHFFLAFTHHPLSERRNYKYLAAFLYFPAFLISLAEITTDVIFTVTYLPGRGYVYAPAIDSPFYLPAAAIFVLLSVFTLAVGISSWKKQETKEAREQTLLVSAGIIIAFICGFFSVFLLPLWGIHIPNLAFIGLICLSGIITYAIIWRGLFTLSPESAATDIIQTLPDGLILADRNGRIVVSNRSTDALFMRTAADLKGQAVDTILPRQTSEAIRKAIEGRNTFTDMESVLDTRDYRVVSIAGAPVIEPRGEMAGIVLIIRDITARKASERALRLVNEKLSLLSQLTRHDINNQIMALNGYLHLSREKAESPVQKQYLSACTRIVGKIESHLRFSRQYEEIGKHEPLWQPVGGLIEQAIADLEFGGVEIFRDVPPVEIYADPLSEKVFYNLLENALRHGGSITSIRIYAGEPAGGELAIVVEDNGTGIAADEKERIFSRFYGKNTGLGLTFSRDILSVTEIRIIETGVPGKGARFEIHVPHQSWRYS